MGDSVVEEDGPGPEGDAHKLQEEGNDEEDVHFRKVQEGDGEGQGQYLQ